MILATTTSTHDSGLLDELVPHFEEASGCSVKTVAVGSGEAIELGAQRRRGRAAGALAGRRGGVHGGRPRREPRGRDAQRLRRGRPGRRPGARRRGRGLGAGVARVAKAEDRFASRGDDSGTHTKELSLWEAAGIEPEGDWYFETGQGMGETLTIAGQKQAYTLSDRGTFLATDNLDLDLLLEGGDDLLNPYHVIVVKADGVNAECGREFSDWITSPGTQRQIGRFGVDEYGEPLFFPDAEG